MSDTASDTVTVFRDGRFMSAPAPEWWDTDIDRLFPEFSDTVEPEAIFGEEHHQQVRM